jgi:hypothetical protein
MNTRVPKSFILQVVILLLLTLLFIPTLSANAQTEPIKVFVDGSLLTLDTPPLIIQSRTLLPLRAVFEALGADVEWDASRQRITATRGTIILTLFIGNTTAQKNGAPVTLDVPPQIINSRTLVPLRFVGEAMGAEVNWDGVARSVTIVSGNGAAPPTKPILPGITIPDWVKTALHLSTVDRLYDSAQIYTDKMAVNPLFNVSQLKPSVQIKPWYQHYNIAWSTGIDYSPYVTFQGNQDGVGGCIGRSMIHVINILKEREHPYTPDMSFWYLHARQEQLAAGGPPDTKYVLEHNGICSEASFPSDYDKAKKVTDAKGKISYDFSALQQPSYGTNLEAAMYKMRESAPYDPTAANIRHLLKTFGPLTAGGPLTLIQGPNPKENHCITIVGYDDLTQTIKCLNSWGDTWENNGYFTVPYDKLAENFFYVKYYTNIPSDRTGTSHAYTARIHVSTGGKSRNKLIVKVGVTGKTPATVWDTPNETLWVDDSKTLNIDVPLPDYAKNHWPPAPTSRWFVEITNTSTWDTAELKEITLARLYKKTDGTFATETFKSDEAGRTIAPGKTEIFYIPKPVTLILPPIKYLPQ